MNITFLGVKPYDEALKFIKHFDLVIIPHLDNELTRNMNPLKAYVYVSLSAPIVSTKINNIDELTEWIKMAETHDEFISILDSYFAGKWQGATREYTQNILYKHSWEQRSSVILELMQPKMQSSNI